jgi:hypothetical protein
MRTDAKISVNMKADGRAYNDDEIELLSRVDSELDRLGVRVKESPTSSGGGSKSNNQGNKK